MLQGFITRDRRKESARESDQHLVDLEQAYAETFPEGAGEDGTAADAVEFVLEDMFNEQSQFEAVLHTLRVLLGSGQPQEAQQLTKDIMRMFSKRGTDRCVHVAKSVPTHVHALPMSLHEQRRHMWIKSLLSIKWCMGGRGAVPGWL